MYSWLSRRSLECHIFALFWVSSFSENYVAAWHRAAGAFTICLSTLFYIIAKSWLLSLWLKGKPASQNLLLKAKPHHCSYVDQLQNDAFNCIVIASWNQSVEDGRREVLVSEKCVQKHFECGSSRSGETALTTLLPLPPPYLGTPTWVSGATETPKHLNVCSSLVFLLQENNGLTNEKLVWH